MALLEVCPPLIRLSINLRERFDYCHLLVRSPLVGRWVGKPVSAKHAVLGLVIDQPSYADRIASGVRRQLRFADLAASYPSWALETLETEGLVRRVDENGDPLRNGTPGRRAIYQATPLGEASFEDWLLSTAAEPPLRDDLHFRIALCRPRDARRMIELIHGQELVCLGRVQDLE